MLGRIDIQALGPKVGTAVINQIAEGQLLRLTIRALDADLAAVIPTAIRYRIDDLDQGTAVLGWTSVTPVSSPQSILITAAQNAIRCNLARERRQVVIEASDSDGAIREVYEYDIINLPVAA